MLCESIYFLTKIAVMKIVVIIIFFHTSKLGKIDGTITPLLEMYQWCVLIKGSRVSLEGKSDWTRDLMED